MQQWQAVIKYLADMVVRATGPVSGKNQRPRYPYKLATTAQERRDHVRARQLKNSRKHRPKAPGVVRPVSKTYIVPRTDGGH